MLEQVLSKADNDPAQIDELIVRVANTCDPQGSLVLEHLKSAHAYLLGAMPAEYVSALELAQASARTLSDEPLRQLLRQQISALLANAPPRRSPEMPWRHHTHQYALLPARVSQNTNVFEAFFAMSATSLGVFYPSNYIVAVFSSFEAAREALGILKEAGFDDREVHAADAAELLAFIEKLHSDRWILGEFMTWFSRALGTEATFIDNDVRWAKEGAGFLAVPCHAESEAAHINELLAKVRPIEMQWYLPGGIRSLV